MSQLLNFTCISRKYDLQSISVSEDKNLIVATPFTASVIVAVLIIIASVSSVLCGLSLSLTVKNRVHQVISIGVPSLFFRFIVVVN
jgi:hypothetical protein